MTTRFLVKETRRDIRLEVLLHGTGNISEATVVKYRLVPMSDTQEQPEMDDEIGWAVYRSRTKGHTEIYSKRFEIVVEGKSEIDLLHELAAMMEERKEIADRIFSTFAGV